MNDAYARTIDECASLVLCGLPLMDAIEDTLAKNCIRLNGLDALDNLTNCVVLQIRARQYEARLAVGYRVDA